MADNLDREAKLKQLENLKATGEKAYDDMYEVHTGEKIDACYHEAKMCFEAAVELARELGLAEEADALWKRAWHIRKVYKGQFSGQ